MGSGELCGSRVGNSRGVGVHSLDVESRGRGSGYGHGSGVIRGRVNGRGGHSGGENNTVFSRGALLDPEGVPLEK